MFPNTSMQLICTKKHFCSRFIYYTQGNCLWLCSMSLYKICSRLTQQQHVVSINPFISQMIV